jgi:hypothetical protein
MQTNKTSKLSNLSLLQLDKKVTSPSADFWLAATSEDIKGASAIWARSTARYVPRFQMVLLAIALYAGLCLFVNSMLEYGLPHFSEVGPLHWVLLLVATVGLIALEYRWIAGHECQEQLSPLCDASISRLNDVARVVDNCAKAAEYRDQVLAQGRELFEIDAKIMFALYRAQVATTVDTEKLEEQAEYDKKRHALCAQLHGIPQIPVETGTA